MFCKSNNRKIKNFSVNMIYHPNFGKCIPNRWYNAQAQYSMNSVKSNIVGGSCVTPLLYISHM
jgi:hypothetical protein